MRNRRDAESQSLDSITEAIIGVCIEVYKALGPGLLESAYERFVAHGLKLKGYKVERQVKVAVEYLGLRLDAGYRIDMVVEDAVVVEIKATEKLLAVHDAQLLTYLKLAGKTVGLLINFSVPVLKDGVRRRVLGFDDTSAPPRLRGSSPGRERS